MKVLVTGGGGFIGGAVLRLLLARGDQVTSLSRGDYPSLRNLGARTLQGDLTNPEAVRAAVSGQDVVVHTAAKAGGWGPAEDYRRTNVVGTQRVIDACRSHGVSRLVFTSTPSVVHGGRNIEGGDESLPYADHYEAPYPATKAEAERRVLAANSDELLTTALRPHLVWGPHDPHLVPRIIDRARRGRLALVGSGANLIDATYIDNAAQAHLDAVDRLWAAAGPTEPPAGRVYFIAQGEPVPISDLLAAILAAADLPPLTRRVPFRMAWTVGAVAEQWHRWVSASSEPVMTRLMARQFATAHWFDLSAAHRDLHYAPHVSMADGMLALRDYLHAD